MRTMNKTLRKAFSCILIVLAILNTAYPVPASETGDVTLQEADVLMEDVAADAMQADAETRSGDNDAENTDAVYTHEENGGEIDSSYSETVPEENEETAIDLDVESSASAVMPDGGIEDAVPEETEFPAEEMVGTRDERCLNITWQDGYIQKIQLDSAASEAQLLSQSRTILTKMGLPSDTYQITADEAGVSAEIISRDYYDGDDEVRVLAHMGYHMTATENTLSAYRVARALGFHYVGGDIRFTKDNVPVVVHDTTINATARKADGNAIGMPVTVRKYNYEELLEYDFGLSTDPVWKGEKIPTLEEYLTLCNKIGLIPNIHIKTDSGLTNENFCSVAEIVMRTGMQGIAAYAANYVSYLRPIIEIDPISIVDIVITDKWDPHYVTDALSLRTGENQVEIGVIRRLYAKSIAATCRFNNILLTTSAVSGEAAKTLDSHVSMISTDGVLPDVIIKGARVRETYGGNYIESDPSARKDYQLLAHANTGVMVRMIASRPQTELRLDTNPDNTEVSMFRFERNSEGYYNIICSRNMLAVGVKGGSTANGAAIILANCNLSFKSQMWTIIHNDDGSVSFINRHSGKALQEVNDLQKRNTHFAQNTYDGRSSQKFWLRLSSKQITMKYVGSVVRLQPQDSTVVIGTAGNSAANGANVQTVKLAENDSQKFTLLYSGDGYYRIVNKKSGLCLTMSGNGPTGNIIAAAWDNKSSQRWKLVWNGNGKGMYVGTYRLICKQGNTGVTIDGTASAGKNIKADWWTGKKEQQWMIKTAALVR